MAARWSVARGVITPGFSVHWLHADTTLACPIDPVAPCQPGSPHVRILVDADACPVKEQIYRVAARYRLPVILAANAPLRIPDQAGVELVHIPGGLDAVDDWIAAEVTAQDIVTTADIPLAGRVVDKGAICIDFRGKELTADALGGLLASREVAQYLRGFGAYGGGPPPLNARDRGRFAGKLDEVVNRRLRATRRAEPGA